MLKKINELNSQDIKKMDEQELVITAMGIRDFLIEKVSKTGGHLASNLGVVELTLGLYKVFNPPTDKILWDVGHQSYVHKILSGRGEYFDTLRTTGGMSGFPKRKESEYDIYDTGHSSTSISAAFGMATARDIKKEKKEIIAVIGDGSLTGGLAFEGLSNLGHSGTKVIVVLNDNGMSISRNTGGLSDHLGKLRTSKGYLFAKNFVKETFDKIPNFGPTLKHVVGDTKDRIKYALLSGGVIFEELGLTYLGPIDGNDIHEVIDTFEQAKKAEGPVIVHAITKKGKGYLPAENNPNKFHGIGPFDPLSGMEVKESKKAFSTVMGETLTELSETNSRLTAITAAMCDATGLNIMEKKYPNRVFDVGIAENCGVVFAAGQALEGLHPVVGIYSSFLQRAYDNIIEDIALQNLPVTFVIDRAGIVGQDGETHHGIFDLSFMLPIPNMTILAPCDATQLKGMLAYACGTERPVAIRYPRGEAKEDLLNGALFSGQNIRLLDGEDLEILAVGTMLEEAMETVELLKRNNIKAGLTYVGVVKPFVPEEKLADTKLIVTMEDNIVAGGFGESIRQFFSGVEILNIGWPNEFIEHGSKDDLMEKYMMDSWGMAERIMDAFERKA